MARVAEHCELKYERNNEVGYDDADDYSDTARGGKHVRSVGIVLHAKHYAAPSTKSN
ncbi:hypothetical protein RSSM_00217 [Rhodopirellula sallentina SM41]|uniref:Uncharacterized protein n=1 Tax=Rhodopirellula sallentina SM41 TaxID=1263870 RepID=M5UA85_9BACT|nr:hypothetical protein RSSM_00217 [Rhodopirellula sallentina SM41]